MQSLLLTIIRWYQKTLSPDHGLLAGGMTRCRFFPSCSEYSYEAIQKYGSVQGIGRSLARILRCHPWSRGGIDHP